jgi:hypothetical protein
MPSPENVTLRKPRRFISWLGGFASYLWAKGFSPTFTPTFGPE